MKIIINHSSMVPIYEQIMEQIKAQVISGELKEGDLLPSVRAMAKELKISALTVKKAYDNLEEEGMTRSASTSLRRSSSISSLFEAAVMKGRRNGMTDEELKELFELIMEE